MNPSIMASPWTVAVDAATSGQPILGTESTLNCPGGGRAPCGEFRQSSH
jgi:hypothetical protein